MAEFGAPLERLAQQMTEIMQQAGGVGLAAPQVGALQRLAIVPDQELQPLVLVNPSLESLGAGRAPALEACLSIYGVQLPVERELAISVTAQNLQGEDIKLEAEGLQARAIQHEVDHLNGVLILDRVPPEIRWMALWQLIAPKTG